MRVLHEYYGEFLQLVPLVVLVWVFLRRRGAVQRIAPILLDINVLIGFVTYFVSGVRVSVWHPILMILAVIIAHAVARVEDRRVVMGAWVLVLLLIVAGILVAKGRIPV